MKYDIIYIGGGLNYEGAILAAKAGKRVLLIERDLKMLGGTCLHRGCIPSKYLLHFAQTRLDLRRNVFRIHKNRLKMDRALAEIEGVLAKATEAIKKQLVYAKVEVVEGEGVVTAPHIVEAAGRRFEGEHIVLGIGSAPFVPEGFEYDGRRVITSDEALRLDTLPESIGIVGGGAIGLEFASFFAANDTNVTLFLRHDTILPKSHPLLSSALMKKLREIGVKFVTDAKISGVKSEKEYAEVTTLSQRYRFDRLLVATGRKPLTDAVATPEITLGKGIETDSRFETTLPAHYAIGDCNGKLQLAHAARAEVRYVTRRILGENPKIVTMEQIPKFINTLPMGFAEVGLTKRELEDRGIDYKESFFALSALTLSGAYDALEGMVILYADSENFIVGAELLAPNAAELIGIAATALSGQLDRDTFLETVFAHPTFSEGFDHAAMRL